MLENSDINKTPQGHEDYWTKINRLSTCEYICDWLVRLSILAVIVGIIITVIGLLPTLGGILSIVIPTATTIFFYWLALKFHKDANILWVKHQPPESFISVVKSPEEEQQPPQGILYNNNSLDRGDNYSQDPSKF